jgi:hypothetical protein
MVNDDTVPGIAVPLRRVQAKFEPGIFTASLLPAASPG